MTKLWNTMTASYGEVNWNILQEIADTAPTVTNNKKITYYNIPCAFDIETSSFYRHLSSQLEKVAIMYEWTVGIYNYIVYGRTWAEFEAFLAKIAEIFETSKKRLVIYIHNAAYEFQFICRRFTWEKVFAIKSRKPVQMITDTGIEFRCSYLLSGKGLAKLSGDLRKYKVKKAVGDLDYSKIRHSKTPLTEKELGYCIDDVRVVLSYIMEKIENDGDISRIPLTKTGYVRNYCRDACYYDKENRKNKRKYYNYRRLMASLTLETDEYAAAKRAFQGGFTHANAFYSRATLKNVRSFDFTSSYPYVMVSEYFPMTKGEEYIPSSKDDFYETMRLYACLIDITLYNVEPKTLVEHPISASRCRNLSGATLDNGRVVSADKITMTITEQDFWVFKDFYTWERVEVLHIWRYMKAYLPTDLVKAILKLYKDKTTLKGVHGMEFEYLLSKEMVNSVYGMCVTDIVRDDDTFDGNEWITTPADTTDEIDHYNKSRRRFISYLWGVWVTAYARRNLFTAIKEFGSDYVYSDTDSVKVLNADRHMDYFRRYNARVQYKLERAAEFHNINMSEFSPSTIEGVEKPLGVWDEEEPYLRFKTLGAKRYMTETAEYGVSITVSGLNKKIAVPYILSQTDNPFEFFDHSMYIPPDYTGKNTHTYIDEPQSGVVTDYLGVPGEYSELSSIHMEAADYSLSMTDEYIDFIKGIRMETR